MRDLRKFRNKLTLELDNRQIAFIFAGELAILAVVFALGVVVGKGLTQTQAQITSGSAMDAPSPKQIFPEGFDEEPLATPTPPVEPSPPTPTPPVEPGTVNLMNIPSPTPASAMPAATPLPAATPKPAATPTPTPPVAKPPAPPAGGGWCVQLSAHENEQEAMDRQKQWNAKGVQAYIVKAAVPGKGTWYRVRVGQFATRDGAQQYADALASKEGIKPYVTPVQ